MQIGPGGTLNSHLAAALRQKMHEAAHAYRAKDYGVWRLARREEEELRLRLTQMFAEVRGWKPAKAEFDFLTLGNGGTRTTGYWLTRLQNSPMIVTRAVLGHPYYSGL